MNNWITNLVCRMLGLSSLFSAGSMQLLAAAGGILAAASHVVLAVSAAPDPAGAISAVKGSSAELGVISAGLGLIISHFRHADAPAAPAAGGADAIPAAPLGK